MSLSKALYPLHSTGLHPGPEINEKLLTGTVDENKRLWDKVSGHKVSRKLLSGQSMMVSP